MKPTIGRIVIYTLSDTQPAVNGSREHPAVITRVWGEGEQSCVNLQVMFDASPVTACTSVLHLDSPARNPGSASWRWPDRAA